MSTVNASYAECGGAWTLCRCTLDPAVDFLAHVPVGLRRFVGMLDTSAYTLATSGEIHFFGVCSQRTWIHESKHAAGGALRIKQSARSGRRRWATTRALPDTYARNNLVEMREQQHPRPSHISSHICRAWRSTMRAHFWAIPAFEPELADARCVHIFLCIRDGN
ncbi:hypothetical protein B0H19DRAFT_1147496 [Mycena capillaripes]|nr:hypothetical protein B0H19DRAFT_1147496 [Mycena capillaripes]